MENSEHDLTPQEIEEILAAAKAAKVAKIKLAEYKKQIWAEKTMAKYSYDGLWEKITKAFIIDEWNRDIMEQLCAYFTEDPRCTLNLNKGILLQGGVGTGKTYIMEWFKRNQKQSYANITCFKMVSHYIEGGYELIQRYKQTLKQHDSDNHWGQKELGCCFDDLGTEELKAYYKGNLANVMENVLFARYENKLLTHLTTNQTIAEMEKMYGTRIVSRFAQMFNQLIFPIDAPDRRKSL